MTTTKLKKFFEEHEYNVELFKQDNQQCAEIESWTDGGVDMIITLQPFSIEEFIKYVNDFNIDEEIDLYRQDKSYKTSFTISESVADFTKYLEELKSVVTELENLK